jgi:hypothetical protein
MQAAALLLVLSLLLSVHSSRAQDSGKYSPRQVKADLKYLYQTLEASHYNLFANTPKKVFDKKYKQIVEGVKDSLTFLQVNRLFQPFVALSQIGHCNAGYPFKSYNAFLARGGRIIPFDVKVENRKAFILYNYSQDSTLQKGNEILSINGIAVNQWLNGLYTYLSGENELYKNTLIDLIGFPRLYWMVFGEQSTYSFKVRRRDNREVVVANQGVQASLYREIRNKRPSVFKANRKLTFFDNIAYLQPGAFMNQQSA